MLDVQYISLDISKRPTPQQVRLGQGDANGTQLVVSVFDGGVEYSLANYSVRLALRLPGNSDAYYEVNGTKSGNVATFNIDETYAASSYGADGFGYVDVMNGSTVICSTSRFQLVVLRSAEDGADPSTSYSSGIIEATEAANAAASSATSAAASATSAASSASSAATNANTKAGLADTAATAANTAAEAANTAAEYASEFTEAYLPLVTSGVSESLLSTDEQTATFTQRVSDHDGSVGVRAILGNTVVWNQVVSFTSNTSHNGVDYVSNADGTVTANGTANGNSFAARQVPSIPIGHKLLLKGCPAGGDASTYSMYCTGTGISPTTARDVGSGAFATVVGTTLFSIVIYITNGTSVSNMVFKPQLFDLTAMFGAGNEPATVAEFEALFPDDYYTYDAGSLLSVNIEGINDRDIPVSTYFPTGIKSAGTAHDELQRDKAITRIGAVDLGTLTWAYDSNYTVFTSDMIDNMKNDTANNLACSMYTPSPSHSAESPDGTIYTRPYQTGVGVGVKNSAYTDAAAFKTAMSGVYLFYELATPTTVDIDPPINMDYLTEKSGVESIVVPTGEQSAPITLVYVQGYDADGVADKALSVIATLEGAKASTNYAIGAYFVYDGVLYRATSAIATGETITPGSNCTATTVMAELIRLTA